MCVRENHAMKVKQYVVAENILLTLRACRDIVKLWAAGSLPAPVLLRSGIHPGDLRVAPYFRKAHRGEQGVLYTTHNLVAAIRELTDIDMTHPNEHERGKVRRIANPYIILALKLGEAFENGVDEESTVARIRSCDKDYKLITLAHTLLALQRKAKRDRKCEAVDLLKAAA